MGTLAEMRMRQMRNDIRTKSDWLETINDADTRASWAAEAKAMGLTDVEFAYVLGQLEYYASLHLPGSNIRLSAADGVWFSDTLIDGDTTNELKRYAATLENVPDRQKDWCACDQSRVLNLVDPSLFPLIYSRSKLSRQTGTSPQAALDLAALGEFPGSIVEWGKALNNIGGRDSSSSNLNYYLPITDGGCGACSLALEDESLADEESTDYASDKFCWLPSEFRVDIDGAVTIESYINNLHPVRHAALYPIISSIFSKFIPLLEQVVTDLVHLRQRQVIPDSSKYYKCDESESEYYSDDEAEFGRPQPKSFAASTRPVIPYGLYGRRLQAIVKMSNVELTPDYPKYCGDYWNLVGLANERIIATGFFFYDVANIAQSSLSFREAVHDSDFKIVQYDVDMFTKAYGIVTSPDTDFVHLSRGVGNIDIKDGRCLVFPNINQYEMPQLKLADAANPGHCKMLMFYFVDPSTRIPSTEIVPPQQKDWWLERVLASEPFPSLPGLIVDGIMEKVDYPISLKEAKKIRLEQVVEADDFIGHVACKLFQPCFCSPYLNGPQPTSY
ncbi:hypothetical protein H4R27_004592 [Coemansia aciculifera]|nr:hypothetical protein H4R27_004592 [Coemansia aciculifera]